MYKKLLWGFRMARAGLTAVSFSSVPWAACQRMPSAGLVDLLHSVVQPPLPPQSPLRTRRPFPWWLTYLFTLKLLGLVFDLLMRSPVR